jgi:hypothetical protein
MYAKLRNCIIMPYINYYQYFSELMAALSSFIVNLPNRAVLLLVLCHVIITQNCECRQTDSRRNSTQHDQVIEFALIGTKYWLSAKGRSDPAKVN